MCFTLTQLKHFIKHLVGIHSTHYVNIISFNTPYQTAQKPNNQHIIITYKSTETQQ
ncbi:hypothetical protein Hanom_Chr12g01172581 [Helianthus anomalus]